MQCNLIWDFIHYEFELGHSIVEATKNIPCVKVDGAVDDCMVIRWSKKFCLGYKDLDD